LDLNISDELFQKRALRAKFDIDTFLFGIPG